MASFRDTCAFIQSDVSRHGHTVRGWRKEYPKGYRGLSQESVPRLARGHSWAAERPPRQPWVVCEVAGVETLDL